MPNAQAYDLFNPPVETKEATETARYSQGVIPDTSKATLFENLGTGVAQGMKAYSAYGDVLLREKITAAADEIIDPFIGQGKSPAGAGPDSKAPDELVRTGERLKRLDAGVKAGTVLNSHYW